MPQEPSPLEKIHSFIGQDIPPALAQWPQREQAWVTQYYQAADEAQVYEVILPPAVFLFDCIADRVMLAYAISSEPFMKRNASRSRGFANVNASVQSALGEQAFVADTGHFLGHASGGQLDINLFAQRRELNRGWSAEGKVYRQMETYVAANLGTFFYHRPIYDDASSIPAQLEYGVLRTDGSWWVELFANKNA